MLLNESLNALNLAGSAWLRRRQGLLLSLLVLLLPATALANHPTKDDLEFYLMDLEAEDWLLAESVSTYGSDGTFWIELGSFLEALEFGMERKGRVWSGWFREEDRSFSWDMDRGLVEIAGAEAFELADDCWFDDEEGTFVSLGTLEVWFGLELVPDVPIQRIVVRSEEPLPFQRWAAREASRKRHRRARRKDVDVVVPDQYHWLTLPRFDLSTNHRYQRANGKGSTAQSLALIMGLDLFKHSAFYAGTVDYGTEPGTTTHHRLTVKRTAATRDGTIFLGANRYSVGDVYGVTSNLVTSAGNGLGFTLERERTSRESTLNVVTLTGDAPSGWEAELYRNGILIGLGVVDRDGRYVFEGQETMFGENIFDVKLHGPQGQVQQDRQILWGGGTELAKGDFDYSLSYIDFSRRLLGPFVGDERGLASKSTADLRYTYGLTEDVQLGVGNTWAKLGTRGADGSFSDDLYASLFGRAKVWRGVLLTEAAHQRGRGFAWSLEYLTTQLGNNISIAHQGFEDFLSPYTVRRTALRRRNQLTVSGPLRKLGLTGYLLQLTHQGRLGPGNDLRVFSRLGGHWGPLNVANDLTLHYFSGGRSSHNGQLRVAARRGRLGVSGEVNYAPGGRDFIRQIAGSVRWRIGSRFQNTFTMTKNFSGSRIFRADNVLSVRVRDFHLSLTTNVGTNDSWAVGLGFNVYFGYDGRTGEFVTSERSMATTGRATLNLFVDRDDDGIRDAGEEPVSWAKYENEETSEVAPGSLSLTAVPPGRSFHFDAEKLKFDDPFLVPRDEIYEIYTHVGSDIVVDIALVMTGDIEGYVYLAPATDRLGVRGARVSLHDAEGEEVAVTRTEFDGYYSFNRVRCGEYEIRMTPPFGAEGGYSQRFELDSEEGYKLVDEFYVYESRLQDRDRDVVADAGALPARVHGGRADVQANEERLVRSGGLGDPGPITDFLGAAVIDAEGLVQREATRGADVLHHDVEGDR